MADIEHKLLSELLDPEACAMVDEVGLSPRVFEDPVCRAAFGWMIDYWRETGKAPTRMVMEHEFPTVELESEVEETTGWMISALRDRHLINRTQNAMRESIVKLDDDPEQTLTELVRLSIRSWIRQAGSVTATGCRSCGPQPISAPPSSHAGWPRIGYPEGLSVCWWAMRASGSHSYLGVPGRSGDHRQAAAGVRHS